MNRGQYLKALLLLLFLLAPQLTQAQGRAEVATEHATVTLLAQRPQAVPGQTLWLGLHFQLIPHWHVYWRNPGASGAAPVIRWTLPDGWSAGEIHWPVPKRIRVGPLTNYGYEDRVSLLVPVQVPDSPLPAGPLTIAADAEWLVCRVECIPENGRFRLEINAPPADSSPHAAPDHSDLFVAARRQWPQAESLSGLYRLNGERIEITVPGLGVEGAEPVADVWFAAHEWGPLDASGPQRWRRTPTGIALSVPAGDLPPAGNTPMEGLLVVESHNRAPTEQPGYSLRLEPALPPAREGANLALLTALGLAFLGGLVLNVMPCVLPVLGIKLMGFARESGAHRRRLAWHGLMYAIGVLASFALLAAVLLALRAGGAALGWGFQLQSPVLVALLAYLMLLIGLNLSGVFSVGNGLMGAGQSLTRGGASLNTFATGVLAAVVASPCTAPFMGTALGFAVTRPAGEAFAVFLALGAGFALPVLLLSLLPAWLRFLPKPGPWMRRLQQILAFPMYATAAWLLWVLSQQTDPTAYGVALAGLIALAMAAWLYGQWRPRGWRLGLLGAGVAAVLGLVVVPMAAKDTPADPVAGHDQRQWSEQRVRELTAAGRPVFVNFTAAWCITCKVNERVALATGNTQRLFQSHSVAYLVADWTRRDPEIARQLERYGRSGVPLYLLYSPTAGQPRVLPQLLTEGIVADAIQTL